MVENLLSSKPTEFYLGGINKEVMIQNKCEFTIDRNYFVVKLFINR